MTKKIQITLPDTIESKILFLRGQKVMLDSDLAQLYGVQTKVLNQAVKRNLQRFPADFMFKLSMDEAREVTTSRSQIVTLKKGQNIKYAPYVFTEHGAVMLASVLNSKVAIDTSVQIVRAFVRLRSILAAHKELSKKMDRLEHAHSTDVKTLLELIQKYIQPKHKAIHRIGFRTSGK